MLLGKHREKPIVFSYRKMSYKSILSFNMLKDIQIWARINIQCLITWHCIYSTIPKEASQFNFFL